MLLDHLADRFAFDLWGRRFTPSTLLSSCVSRCASAQVPGVSTRRDADGRRAEADFESRARAWQFHIVDVSCGAYFERSSGAPFRVAGTGRRREL